MKIVNISNAPAAAGVDEWWQVPIFNMGFCKDGVTRWYICEGADGQEFITFKH